MDLKEILIAIGEDESIEVVRPDWEESIATFPSGTPTFLEKTQYRESREWCGLDAELDSFLDAAAKKTITTPALARLAWHWTRRLYECPEQIKGNEKWPIMERALGDLAGGFLLLIALAMVPYVRERHRSMQIEETIMRETCFQIRDYCRNYRKGHDGRPGVSPKQLYWLRRYVDGELFRLGRMEYFLDRFRHYAGWCEVYRNRGNDEVLALAPDGVRFDGDGRVYAPHEGSETADCWTSTLRIDRPDVTGHPISPDGRAHSRCVTLPLDQWHHVLGLDHWILSMHIPSGGGLTPAAFIDSVRRGVAFFGQHFPDRLSVATICHSWIFSDALERILPETTNLVRNLREVYLWPAPSSGPYENLWSLFCTADGTIDPLAIEPETSLERAVIDYLRSGGRWRSGAMFLLHEDLPRFGTQYYRAHWPPRKLQSH